MKRDYQTRQSLFFYMEISYCHTVIFALFCPRGFAIPELVTADFQSARVTDPLLSTLWIANPQGRKDKSFFRYRFNVLGDL